MKREAVLGAWLMLSTLPGAWAQSPVAAPEDVEAAYLYQFGRYVDWPPELVEDSDTFEICVIGVDRLEGALTETVAGKVITGRRVAAKRIGEPAESSHCRILFVSSSESARTPEILEAISGMQVLTVGRGADFTRLGGMIGFTSDVRRVRFVVNLAAADAVKLMLSSQLLRIAVRVDR